MSTEEAGKKALNDLKPFQCPMCKYKAATASLLSRHINFHHPEMRDRVPGHLLNVLNGKKNVPDMLVSVAKWIENATTFDERLPEDVISYLKREDAKTQLILRVIAIGKIQRAMEIGDKIKDLDVELDKKLSDAQFKKDASPGTYLGLIERLQALQVQVPPLVVHFQAPQALPAHQLHQVLQALPALHFRVPQVLRAQVQAVQVAQVPLQLAVLPVQAQAVQAVQAPLQLAVLPVQAQAVQAVQAPL